MPATTQVTLNRQAAQPPIDRSKQSISEISGNPTKDDLKNSGQKRPVFPVPNLHPTAP
jgi:hypothetical protein